MPEPHEARIVTRPRSDGTTEISVYVPSTGREHRTGLAVPNSQVDANCKKLSETFQRAGNRVGHKEL